MALLHPDRRIHALILLGQHESHNATSTAATVAVRGVVVTDGVETEWTVNLEGSPLIHLNTGTILDFGVAHHPGGLTALGKNAECFGGWRKENRVLNALLL